MKIFERKQYICSVELCSLLPKPTNLLQVKKEIATRTIIKCHIQIFIVLKSIMHSNYVGMLHLVKYTNLRQRILLKPLLLNLRLLQPFQRIQFTFVATTPLLNQSHFPVVALSDHRYHFEVSLAGIVFGMLIFLLNLLFNIFYLSDLYICRFLLSNIDSLLVFFIFIVFIIVISCHLFLPNLSILFKLLKSLI